LNPPALTSSRLIPPWDQLRHVRAFRPELTSRVIGRRLDVMRRSLPVVVVALVLVLVACQPDPTTGRPPPVGAPDPGYQSFVKTVNAVDLPFSWRAGCPVGPGDLRSLTLRHWAFDGQFRTGVLILHRDVVTSVDAVFRHLFTQRFQIERIEPIDVYRGSDPASMDANNTSAFNCRAVTGGTGWSEHSYGWAIDINPAQNPYVNGRTVLPEAGRQWLNRGDVVPGMIVAPGAVVDGFRYIGWGWGGDWTSLKDYQHVSMTGR
jgi:hypothetical protein